MVLNKLRNIGFPGVDDFCNKKLFFCKIVVQKGFKVVSVGVGNVNTYIQRLSKGYFYKSYFFLHYVVHLL